MDRAIPKEVRRKARRKALLRAGLAAVALCDFKCLTGAKVVKKFIVEQFTTYIFGARENQGVDLQGKTLYLCTTLS